jgi:ABC-2 type transport system permease protein
VSLYTAETRRLVKRRFTRFFTLGALLVLAAVAVGMFFTNQKVGPAQVASARAQAEAEYDQAVKQAATDRQNCEAAQGTPAAGQYPPACNQMYAPTKEDFDPAWYMPATFDFRKNFPDMVTTLAALLAMAAFVVGASFVGAEWSSGGMMNLLLWRPQRLKVLGTKLVALLVGLTAVTAVLSAIWTGIFVVVAGARGTTASMTSGAWQSILLMELRGLAVVLVAGALGFGLASIGRHTAMALGAAIGVVIVFQFGLGTVLSMAQVKFAEAYLIPVWAIAWMNKSYKVEDFNSCDFSSVDGCRPDSLTITWPMAGAVLAAVFVLVVGAAMWTMRSRDIT